MKQWIYHKTRGNKQWVALFGLPKDRLIKSAASLKTENYERQEQTISEKVITPFRIATPVQQVIDGDQKLEQVKQPSNWVKLINQHDKVKQIATKKVQNDPDHQSRMARLAKLFESDDEDDTVDKADDKLDHLAAQENMNKFMSKLD